MAYMTKFAKACLILIVIGLLISSLLFAYYHFHWGIKPCEGLPTDAANCGDADLGGVVFVLIGVPLALLGLVGLIASTIAGFVDRHKRTR
jgi:membrane protease YdiL (CAAX protease family)